MKINTVALMGAGAVGAFFIQNMTPRMGENFFVIAEGDRKKCLESEGLIINGQTFFPHVKTPAQASGVDLLLIATKYFSLKESADEIRTIAGPNTLVLTVLNGIDSEEIVESFIGSGHVLRSFMLIVAHRQGNEILYNEEKTRGVVFGEEDGSITERVQAICDVFDKNHVKYRVPENIAEEQWNKFGMNIANNLPQAVLGVGYHSYFNSKHMEYIHERILQEFFEVSAVKGYRIFMIPTSPEAALPEARFSTLQDLDAKRHTEVDMFLGVFLKQAKQLGIETPFCEYTYHAIKVLEEKNDGKIK